MRNSLWVVNSSLLLIFFILIFYFIFVPKNIPNASVIMRAANNVQQNIHIQDRNLKKLYENGDIFGNNFQNKIPEIKSIKESKEPKAPAIIKFNPSVEPLAEFLPPLPIVVTGIDYSSSNEQNSGVSILKKDSKESSRYKIGDKIFDSVIIRILPDKIVLLRSNGIQEIHYTKSGKQRLIKDFSINNWDSFIKNKESGEYLVDPYKFTEYITTLAEFINKLNLFSIEPELDNSVKQTYCKIGSIKEDSIGYALGLAPQDIITKISGIDCDSTENRILIYNLISSLEPGDSFDVELIRNSENMTLSYKLRKFRDFETTEITSEISKTEPIRELSDEEIQKIKDEQIELKPVTEEIKQQDKLAMDIYGDKEIFN